jgi:hypothetical protein
MQYMRMWVLRLLPSLLQLIGMVVSIFN